LLNRDWPLVRRCRSSAAAASKIAAGSLRGVPERDEVMVSLQNCMRIWPIVGWEVVSATRATSTLKARSAR